VLNAVDESPTPPFAADGSPLDVPNKVTTVARVSHGLRRSDYVGGIMTHSSNDGRDNLVAGGDVALRFSSADSFNAAFLGSRTSGGGAGARAGTAMQATYQHSTRRWLTLTQAEHYDRDFSMETAFFNRVGFSTVWNYTELNFYPKSKWLQRIGPFAFARAGRDRIQNGNEELRVLQFLAQSWT
jgi:hypothetical protein